MKKFLSLVLLFFSLTAMAQYPVSNISITLPPQPMPNVGDWTMPFVISAQARLVQGQVPGNLVESRILVTIKKNGSKFCGNYTQQNAPYSQFSTPTKTWTGGTAIGLVSTNCEMPPGNYELCVQFFSSTAPVISLSNEVCKSFTIPDKNNGGAFNYSPPQNMTPFDGKTFTQQEASLPIMLRWTPVIPRPKEDVIYKVRLIEIKAGQLKAQALKVNKPIEILEIKNATQTAFKLAQRCNGCEYIWNVEAVGTERGQGETIKSYGTSEATQFSFGKSNPNAKLNAVQCNIEMQPVELATCTNRRDANGNYIYKVCFLLEDKNPDNLIYFNHSINSANLANLITIDNAVSGHTYNITPVSPSFPLPDILRPNTNYPICFEIAIPTSQTFPVQYTLHSTTHDSLTSASVIKRACDKTNTIKAVESCRCEFCDALNKDHFSQANYQYSADNNSLQLNQMLNLPAQYNIKQLKAELVTFDWQTDNADCRKCQKDDHQFGVITDGTLTAGGYTTDGAYPDGVPNSHELDFNCLPANGIVLNNGASVNLNISLPLQTALSCCQDKFTFCIRYTIVTADCKTCSIVKCYTQVPPRQHKIINSGNVNSN